MGVDTNAQYLIGSCMKNITSDGSPAWQWAPLMMDEEFNHESASYSNEPLPECGEWGGVKLYKLNDDKCLFYALDFCV